MTHYDTLQVVPWAKDSVIRAAYRALMRESHPDTNPKPDAQQRAREIAAAFAVVGDPEKRAAYDALPGLADADTIPERPSPAAAKRTGRPIPASAPALALAAILSVAIGVATQWPAQPGVQRQHKPVAQSPAAAVARKNPLGTAARAEQQALPQRAAPAEPQLTARAAALPGPVPTPVGRQGTAPAKPEIAQLAKTAQPRVVAAVEVRQRPASPAPERTADRRPASASPTQIASACPAGPSPAGGSCADDRQKQIERMATSFLQQSIDNSNGQKQQLLLSTRLRAWKARQMCRSNECVTQAYLRQISDTHAIMAGGTPTP